MIADMIKIYYWIVFPVVTIAFCSCSEEFNNSNYIVDLKSHTITINAPATIPAMESIQNIQINATEDCEWKIISATPDWIIIDKIAGIGPGNVKISVSSNDIVDERYAELCFEGRDMYGLWRQNITLQQIGVDAFFVIDNTLSDTIPAQAVDTAIVFRTNIDDYKFSISDEWVTVTEKDSMLCITVAENLTPSCRKCDITISGKRIQDTHITLLQKQYELSVTPANQVFYNNRPAQGNITISTEEQITVRAPQWITTKSIQNEGNKLIIFDLLENNSGNDRFGEIVISLARIPQISQAVKVIQYYNFCNGYEFVDLGLPSGTLWGYHNIGAESVSDLGTESHVPYERSGDSFVADSSCIWGNPWRIPAVTQFEELLNYCDYEYFYASRMYWHKYVSTINGESIIFPDCEHLSTEIKEFQWVSFENGQQVGDWKWNIGSTALKGHQLVSTHDGTKGYIRPVMKR